MPKKKKKKKKKDSKTTGRSGGSSLTTRKTTNVGKSAPQTRRSQVLQMTYNTNGWDQYKIMVINELERTNKRLETMDKRLSKIERNIAVLQTIRIRASRCPCEKWR